MPLHIYAPRPRGVFPRRASCLGRLGFALALVLSPVLPQVGLDMALAQGIPVVRQLQDSVGNQRTIICQPGTVQESAVIPVSVPARQPVTPVVVQAQPLPLSPAVGASPVIPVVQPVVAAPIPCGSYGALAPVSPPSTRLYAHPADIECAFNYYVPRKPAFGARGTLGPDPAIHGALPPLRRGTTTAARRPATTTAKASTTAPAPAETKKSEPLCPPVATPPTGAPITPQTAAPAAGAPVAAPLAAATPVRGVETSPIAPVPGNGAPRQPGTLPQAVNPVDNAATASAGLAGGVPAVAARPGPASLINAQPMLPTTSRQRGGIN